MTYLYADKIIYVSVFGLFLSALQIVIAPIAVGIIARKMFKDNIDSIIEFLPSVSIIAIILIVGVIVAVSKQSIAMLGLALGLLMFCTIHLVLQLVILRQGFWEWTLKKPGL